MSAADLGSPVLVVSQFTLYADTRKGRRPSWQDAAPGESPSRWWTWSSPELRRRGCTVATGVFGARMQVCVGQRGTDDAAAGDLSARALNYIAGISVLEGEHAG